MIFKILSMVNHPLVRRHIIVTIAGLVLSLFTLVGVVTVGHSQEAKNLSRLSEAKLKACQTREKTIQGRSDQLVKLATTMQKKFDTHVSRVETYHTTKVIPSGKTVSNYDALVSDIATKKAASATALAKAQASASSFSCTASDPKGQLAQFRTDMQAGKKALHDYRTAIKNLIVAVRSVSGQKE